MAVFIDTGIFVGLRNADDKLHTRSKELMMRALKSDFDRIYTSDYLIDEAITTALIRTRRQDLATDLGKYVIESPRIIKLWVEKDTFEKAWKKFNTLKDKSLCFTDCTTLALIETTRIKQIMTFDSGFDVLAQRIC